MEPLQSACPVKAVAPAAYPLLETIASSQRWLTGFVRRLTNHEHKDLPQFGGGCANGIHWAVPWGAGVEPNTWRLYFGMLYVFDRQPSRDQFELETALNLQRAQPHWNDEVGGSDAVGGVSSVSSFVCRPDEALSVEERCRTQLDRA